MANYIIKFTGDTKIFASFTTYPAALFAILDALRIVKESETRIYFSEDKKIMYVENIYTGECMELISA